MITKILEYLGIRPKKPLTQRHDLVEFIHRNASFVSQVVLLTYIKARAGTQYPKLFEHADCRTPSGLWKTRGTRHSGVTHAGLRT